MVYFKPMVHLIVDGQVVYFRAMVHLIVEGQVVYFRPMVPFDSRGSSGLF